MNPLSNYQLVEEIYGSGHTRVCRAVSLADRQPVILKILSGETLHSDVYAQYQHEFEVTRSLADIEDVIKVRALEAVQDSLMIVEEDIGGQSLAKTLQSGQIGLEEGLDLAVRITHVLGQIHQRRVIHKDCTPANIIWNRETGALRIIDFGISSQLSQERLDFQNVNQLEANLAYASPEQTGRVNRKLDYRSDLYSLGVTLYQMFTGSLPFLARAGIELVHAHIALMPAAPHEIAPDLPRPLSDIIMRLMAKMADDRYQSAWGLEHDLRRCLDSLRRAGGIAPFELGEKDASTRMQIPQKLYGREAETAAIIAAFERAAMGPAELLLVSGFSGTGKSALVHEVHKPLTERRGSFISGKFDQYQRDVPFYAWKMAFEEFCNLLLKEDETSLARWRERIAGALGTIGKVVAEVIPSIELIVGPQPEVPPLAGEQALNRLNYAFANFLKALCIKDFPLVVFIDDWQWADAGSLSLLKSVMADKEIRHLLLIGAYRDNEIHTAHPLSLALDDIGKAEGRMITIELPPLGRADVRDLVRDTLNDAPGVEDVARVIYGKTQGNAFFTVQLLTDLYETSVIRFSLEDWRWVWRQADIESRDISGNVVDLMTVKIGRLPEKVQRTLIHASCIGDRFELSTLAAILEKPAHMAAAELEQALQEGILVPVGLNYRIARQKGNTANVTYQFVHDRVRQAAQGMLERNAGEKIHFDIASKWLSEFSEEEQELRIFDIANQFNAGRNCIAAADQRTRLAMINLRAGRRAKSATAYPTALHYLQMAMELLPGDCWASLPAETAELYLLAAEVAFLTKDYPAMEGWVDTYLTHRDTPLEQVGAHKIRIMAYVAQNRLSEAVAVSLHALGLVGVPLPDAPTGAEVMEQLTQTIGMLSGKSMDELLNLPAMTDPARLAAMDLLGLALPPAYWTSQELLALVVFQMVQQTVLHGHSPNAGYGFSWWGIIDCAILGNIEEGCTFGTFAIELARRHGLNLQQPLFFEAWIVRKYRRHLAESIPLFEQTFALSLEIGDFEYASYARNNHMQALFHLGRGLDSLLDEMERAHRDLQRFQVGSSLYWHDIWWQAAINLARPCSAPDVLAGPAYDEAVSVPQHLKVNDASTLFLLYQAKLLIACVMGDRAAAAAHAERARGYCKGGVGMHAFTLFHAYESLALLANAETLGKRKVAKLVAENQEKLKVWADNAPMNYRHHWLLVEAERLRVAGKSDQSIRLYDEAIDQARAGGFLHEEALAHELTARCYMERGQERLAGFYLRHALQLYERWGAQTKTARLTAEFPELLLTVALTADHQRTSRDKSGGRSGSQSHKAFDALALTQASQAISREIVIGDMITTLLRIVIEHSGAQKALLVLKKGDELFIEAQGVARESTEITVRSIPIGEEGELPLPRSMIQFAVRTAKSQVIHDARQGSIFSTDPYFVRVRPLSVLCEPIVHQGKLVGMLYLENNLTVGAFTEERLELLRHLSAQAAIAIENAQLYADMEARVRDRTRELAESLQTVRVKSSQVSALLDNSGQGFLSFGPDLVVEPEFSQACLTVFGGSPAGRPVDELLCQDSAAGRETLRACVQAAFDDDDPLRRHLYLSLLPEEIVVGDKALKTEFRMLERAIMAVVTDVTEEKALAAQVERERGRLEMIVAAVTCGNDFFDAVADFRDFARDGAAPWSNGGGKAPLYRAIHTFKGTFNQFGFHHVTQALHAVESSLQALPEHARGVEAAALAFDRDWNALLDTDLETVTSSLGEDFMARRGFVAIPPDQARRFELFARGLLSKAEAPKVLEEIAAIRTVSLKQGLAEYDKLIQQVSRRLEKAVAPLEISGGDIRVDPETMGPFLRSLGHVFRNAVDHGIEHPDTRLAAGKSEFGIITCAIGGDSDTITIEITDDGGGIDVEGLRQRAAAIIGQDVSAWGLADLVFAEGVSSRVEATDLSGRGVGMPAVKAAILELGGSVRLDTRPGRGTSFLFRVPARPAERRRS